MKESNVFESSRFVYFMNKLICNLFLTLTKIKGSNKYRAKTTSLDMIVFGTSLSASIWFFADILKTPLKRTSRSLILELSLFANGKLRTIQPILVILSSFYNRFKYVELLNAFQSIDNHVGIILENWWEFDRKMHSNVDFHSLNLILYFFVINF